MKTSKFAPKTPLEQLKQSEAERLRRDKDRAARLLLRLRWKAELLLVSHSKAMDMLRAVEQQDEHHDSFAAVAGQAESMFKVDFFEFYTFLERFITVCLSTLGVSVSAALPRENFNALRYITNPDLHRTRPLASHAFHANLLEALDDESCPLHGALGVQDVRIQLGLAKDYRNAWKDADGKDAPNYQDNGNDSSSKNVKLPELDLHTMLRTLITGCGHAHNVVQAHLGADVNGSDLSSRDFEALTYTQDSMEMTDMPFEYMDDAMELD